MSKKDYEAIAAGIRPSVDAALLFGDLPGVPQVRNTLRALTYNIIQRLAADNERFNHKTFWVACGFTEDGRWLDEVPA